MRQQTRPFTVETKSRRKPSEARTNGAASKFDGLALDGLPVGDVHEDVAGVSSPFEAANRLFRTAASSFAVVANARSPVGYGFVLCPSGAVEPAAEVDPGPRRTGRILPSLASGNPFEAAADEPVAPKPRKARSKPALRSAAVPEPKSAVEQPDASPGPIFAPAAVIQAAEKAIRQSRRAKRRKEGRRVPAGERWKRRRLPKACW
jgi:hypothetical protein